VEQNAFRAQNKARGLPSAHPDDLNRVRSPVSKISENSPVRHGTAKFAIDTLDTTPTHRRPPPSRRI